MITFTEYLIGESLDSPLSYSWKRQTEKKWEAEFTIDKQKMVVYFNIYPSIGSAEVLFYDENAMNPDEAHKMFSLTGGGNSIKIFATIAAIVKDFLGKQRRNDDWDTFSFSADLRDRSRLKLYDRFAGMLRMAGYWKDSDVVEGNGERKYMFYK